MRKGWGSPAWFRAASHTLKEAFEVYPRGVKRSTRPEAGLACRHTPRMSRVAVARAPGAPCAKRTRPPGVHHVDVAVDIASRAECDARSSRGARPIVDGRAVGAPAHAVTRIPTAIRQGRSSPRRITMLARPCVLSALRVGWRDAIGHAFYWKRPRNYSRMPPIRPHAMTRVASSEHARRSTCVPPLGARIECGQGDLASHTGSRRTSPA